MAAWRPATFVPPRRVESEIPGGRRPQTDRRSEVAAMIPALRRTADPVTHLDDTERDTLRQAITDAIDLRVKAAAEPCPDCVTHPALLCPGHAAELDWVSLYRELAHDLRITLRPS